jgi:hypothetical protein
MSRHVYQVPLRSRLPECLAFATQLFSFLDLWASDPAEQKSLVPGRSWPCVKWIYPDEAFRDVERSYNHPTSTTVHLQCFRSIAPLHPSIVFPGSVRELKGKISLGLIQIQSSSRSPQIYRPFHSRATRAGAGSRTLSLFCGRQTSINNELQKLGHVEGLPWYEVETIAEEAGLRLCLQPVWRRRSE